MNFENGFSYDFVQYTIVSHVLTLGFAAMAAGLVYFLVTSRSVLPRYRLSSTLSMVVMTSAVFELYILSQQWQEAFTWNGEAFVQAETLFSNGFRYTNWSIDVPVLLIQLLIVLGVTGTAFKRGVLLFIAGGLLMIYTGYVGQFYEVEGSAPFWVWGAVSTVFFIGLIVLVARAIFGNLHRLPQEVRPLMRGVFWLLVISWLLYPLGYLLPVMWDTADGVVARQITYTIADISSKIIYGIVLGLIAQKISKIEGFEPALAAEATVPRGGITDKETPGRI